MGDTGCTCPDENTRLGDCPRHGREIAPPGVDTAMRVAGHLPRLLPGERDCPTCGGAGYIVVYGTPKVCPKCDGERKVSA